jgi:hypothetical protein
MVIVMLLVTATEAWSRLSHVQARQWCRDRVSEFREFAVNGGGIVFTRSWGDGVTLQVWSFNSLDDFNGLRKILERPDSAQYFTYRVYGGVTSQGLDDLRVFDPLIELAKG